MCSTTIIAQSITITGRVIDDDTEEGVPFCSVFMDGETPLGATSDVDGNYSLTLELSQITVDSLTAASVGYTKVVKPFDRQLSEQVVNFRLKGSAYTITEVEVLAGENPANEIVRQIIKNKKRNKRSNFDNYQVEMYSKTELDLNNIDPEMKDSKLFKEVQFIFENIDSVSDVRPFLPAYVAERIYEVYAMKNRPDREVLKAQKVSGVTNSSVVDFINKLHEKYSIYDNYITVLGKEFISPFSNQGLGFYEYYILDSTHIDDIWSYKLKFKPKRKGENTFYGDFWVSMEDYGLEIVNMRMSPGVNVNLVSRLLIYQEFKRQDSLWLPHKEKTIIDFAINKKENRPGIIGRKTQMYKDFKVNIPDFDESFKKADPEDIDHLALEKADTFWSNNRHEILTENEEKVYKMVDSIKSLPIYRKGEYLFYTLAGGYIMLGSINKALFEVGPYWNLYNYNDVEGWRFGMGLGTTSNFSEKLWVYGYAAYGLHDQRWKYNGHFQYVFNRYRRREIGARYQDDVMFEYKSSEEALSQGLFAGFLRRNVPAKLLRVREAKLYYHHTWKKGWSNHLAVLHRDLQPFGDPFTISGNGFNYRYLPDPNDATRIDSTVTTTEVLFRTRFAYKEQLLRSYFSDVSIGTEFPIIELTYTGGFRGILNSEYNYHRLVLTLKHWFYVGPMGWMEYRIEGGKVFGQVPFLLLETHPGNEAYFYNSNAYNMMNSFEFASDLWAGVRVVQHFDGFFLNRIPFIRKLKLRELAFFRAVYGTLEQANIDANRLNYQAEGGPYYGSFDRGPYMEAGFGIENILKFIRVDALWRLNYWDNQDAQRFSVRVTFDFNF